MQFKTLCLSAGCLAAAFTVGGLMSQRMPESRGQEAAVTPQRVAQVSGAQDRAARASNPADTNRYLGSGGCVQCHQGLSRALNSDRFLPLTEPEVWLTDPHSKAFEFIDWSKATETTTLTTSQQLSREICRKLGIADIHKAQECLSCHAGWVADLDQPPPIYELGVACESCHGPSADWDGQHRNRQWRQQSVAYKADLGMVDVRNPVKRAEQCFSCHIGNVAQGKLLTHEMYAAGHPPLPSIEIESFARQMPRHWRYLDEKIADSRRDGAAADEDAPPFEFFAEFVEQNHTYLEAADATARLKVAQEHHHGAAAVVLGGAVALREAVELTRDLAGPAANRAWPELASFDCTACHHDLKRSGGPPGNADQLRPGRPSLHTWPTALVKLAIFHISADAASFQRKSAELNERFAALHENLAATPFGDAGRLQRDATELSAWLTDELIHPVAAKPFDHRAVRLASARLAHMGSQGEHDYDSARQIAWAFRTIYCDLEQKPASDETIRKLLRQLAVDLRLDLPNGSGETCETTSEEHPAALDATPEVPLALAGNVPIALATEVRYDPDRFRETMRELRRLLE